MGSPSGFTMEVCVHLEDARDSRNQAGLAPLPMQRQPIAQPSSARQTSLRPTSSLQTEQPREIRGGAQAGRLA
jgi:hypothetical protein